MAKRREPGIPSWLYDPESLFTYEVCMWKCAVCGAPYFFKRVDKEKHAGPVWRIHDHPEWSPHEGPCWRSQAYKVKCTTPKGVTVLVHDGYDPPNEEQLLRYTASGRSQRRQNKGEAVPARYYEEDGKLWWLP